MRLRFTIPLLALISSPAFAQATPERTASGWLRITVPELNVRFVPELGEENVWCTVGQGSTLRVVGENGSWYLVEPPPNAFCFILGSSVEKMSTLRGVVRSGDKSVPVRVCPEVRIVEPEKMAILNYQSDGAAVDIDGEQGQWLKIKPPAGVVAYVVRDDKYVARVATAEEGVAERAANRDDGRSPTPTTPAPAPPPVSDGGRSVVDLAPVSGSGGALPVPTAAMNANSSSAGDSDVYDMQPVGGAPANRPAMTTEDRVKALMADTPSQPSVPSEPAAAATESAEDDAPGAGGDEVDAEPTPVAPEPPAPTTWRERFHATDREIFAEAAKPVAERDWQRLIDELLPIASQNEDPAVAGLAQWRIGDLRERVDNREFLAQVDAAVHSPNPLPAVRYEEWRVRTNNPASQPILWSAPFFDARGVVMVEPNAPAQSPARMRLVDPFSGMAIAFIDIGGADPAPILNRYVGVRGWTQFDQTLGLRVIRVRELQILPPPLR